jgi:Protein of unknown function (DUF4254)
MTQPRTQESETLLSANAIVRLHDQLTRTWHIKPSETEASTEANTNTRESDPEADWLARVGRQHRTNFDLWHIEDEARTPGATDASLADVKRRIDRTNQLRNDLAEDLDGTLVNWLTAQGLPNPDAPLHSESPGLMIDRLSILALKIYHTREETERADAPAEHTSRNRERLAILEAQRADLANCLHTLWRETLAGTRSFKLYRQMKMYNDPSLNPAIYRNAQCDKDR